MMINYRDVAQRDGAREGALRRPSGRGRRGDQRIDRQGGAQADQGRLRGAAARDRPGRGDAARRADPARGHVARKGVKGAEPKPRPTWSSASSSRMGDVAAGFKQADVIVEREFDTKPCTRAISSRSAWSRPSSEDGQIDLWCCTQAPWVVRAHCADGNSRDRCEQDPRHPLGDGRRLRRQDRLLSRAGGDRCSPQGQAAGEDRDDAQGGVPRHRPDLGHARRASRSASRRTEPSSPRKPSSCSRPAPLPARRVQPGAMCAYAPATTSRT